MDTRIDTRIIKLPVAIAIMGIVALSLIWLAVWSTPRLFPNINDSNSLIHRQINAYQHLPNGNTQVYYDGGSLMQVEGTWYFNQPDRYYEFYRDENSTLWHVSPY